MQGISAEIDADRTPPLAIPLGHFAVATLLLLLGGVLGFVAMVSADAVNTTGMAHLLAAGWIGLTIMGAMTQFVPVWSGVAINSKRLATLELWFVGAGQLTFSLGLLFADVRFVILGASGLFVGVWVFIWNMWRTLPGWSAQDVTERHFTLAIGSLAGGSILGLLLALNFQFDVLTPLGLDRTQLLLSHLTLTIFGFVLGTVIGALYQLGPMFTQSSETPVDMFFREVERYTYFAGVAAFAVGRLLGVRILATAGAIWILVGTFAFSLFFGRRLLRSTVSWGPMLQRYVLVAGSLLLWTILSVVPWLTRPIAVETKFGTPVSSHLLFVGVFGFVIVGTVYHVVPFSVWLDRYADRLGFEKVPAIDELANHRIAQVEFATLSSGFVLMVAGALFELSWLVAAVGGTLLAVGFFAFGINMTIVVWTHHPALVRDIAVALTRGQTDL